MHEVNSQFSEMFNSHETVFASHSSDSGNCSVLEQNVDAERLQPTIQSSIRPLISAANAEFDITDGVQRTDAIETSNSECRPTTATDKRQTAHVDHIQPGNLTPGIDSERLL